MSLVWFNGKLIDGPLPLDPADRGLLLGDGLFETIAVINGKPLWLEEHLARLRSCRRRTRHRRRSCLNPRGHRSASR